MLKFLQGIHIHQGLNGICKFALDVCQTIKKSNSYTRRRGKDRATRKIIT